MEKEYETSDEDIDEEDFRADILIDLSDYADRNPGFNATFVDAVRRHFDKHGTMSSKQYNIMVEIWKKINSP